MQAVMTIDTLPQSSLLAGAEFARDHLSHAQTLIAQDGTAALAIVVPAAPHDHDDWRRTLARDMARAHTPKRVNVVGASDPDSAAPLLAYLRDAPGVTGQYLAAHE